MRLGDDVLYLMSLVLQKHFDGMSRDFLRAGLGRSEWRCLAVLDEREGCIVGDLVELTQQPQTTISKVIGRMERDGLLTRTLREGDARFVEVSITRKGRGKLEQILPVVLRQHDAALAGITARELRELKSMLVRILGNLGASGPKTVSPRGTARPSAVRPGRRRQR